VSALQEALDKLSAMDEVIEVELKGISYTARWFGVGYWVYQTHGAFDDPVYFVSEFKCTCGGYNAMGVCKHYSGLRRRFK
jgi:hypothetical protein